MDIIKIENLCKLYANGKGVKNLSLSVKEGEVFGLLGENGAGKSTAVECALGTKKIDSGKVFIMDMDAKVNRKKLFEKVGVQFQESNYQDKITVKELCEVTQSLYKETLDYKELLKEFNLLDKLKSQVSELSGGEKQRLFIILALIPNPKVIFLDELTTGLDVKARREVWKYLLRLKTQGISIFLTSHFMDEVEVLCDKISILKKGEMIFYGSVKEAIEKSPYENLEDAYLWYVDKEEVDYEGI